MSFTVSSHPGRRIRRDGALRPEEDSMKHHRFASLVLGALLVDTAVSAQVVEVDPALPAYRRGSAVFGNLNAVGSDTMNNLMTYWGEAFAKLYPTVRIQVEGKGSSTAPPALIAGTSQLGPMSRDMKPEEIDAIEKKYGDRKSVV
jgi:phosphate transport system substrate-binding protein